MSFGRFRLVSALSASAFCFWKRAGCTPSDDDYLRSKDSKTKVGACIATKYPRRLVDLGHKEIVRMKTVKSSSPDLASSDFFMALAFLASSRSKDGDRQIGACTVIDGELAGLGYNGMPDGPGFKDFKMEYRKPMKHKLECHAEVNAISSALRRQADLSKSTLYVTDSPCSECCKLVLQSGIRKVVWAKDYDQMVKPHMEPIHKCAKREDKNEEKRFCAAEQYLTPLCEEITVEKYQGETVVRIDLGPSLWGEDSNEEKDIAHCKIVPKQHKGKEKEGADGKGKDQKKEKGAEEQDGKEEVAAEEEDGKGKEGAKNQDGKGQGKQKLVPRGHGKRKVDITKDDFFMAIAKLATTQSSSRAKVGACLVTVDPPRAVSIGYSECREYNKSLEGVTATKSECKETEPYEMQICAASNAIMSAFRVHADLTSSVLYVTSPMCSDCAKIAVQSGVKTVIYSPSYSEEKDTVEKKAVKEIFDQARIPYVEYRRRTEKERTEEERYIIHHLVKKKIVENEEHGKPKDGKVHNN